MDVINTTLILTTILQNEAMSSLGGFGSSMSMSSEIGRTDKLSTVHSSSYALTTTPHDVITTSYLTTLYRTSHGTQEGTQQNTYRSTSFTTEAPIMETTANSPSVTSKKTKQGTIVTLDMISAKQLRTFIPAIIFAFLLMLIGIPGNAIAGYVYFKKWRRSSTRTFILTLAYLDLINCCISLPFELAVMLLPLKFDEGVVCKIMRFTTYLCNTSAALILIAIAVDRYHRICKPLEDHMTSKKAKITILIILVAAVFTMSPSLLLYGTRTIPIPVGPKTFVFGKLCSIEDYFVPTKYPLVFFIFNCVATSVIFLVLTVLYTFVAIQVCRRNRLRKLTRSVRSLSDFSVEDEDDKLYIGNTSSTKTKPSSKELSPLNDEDSLNGTLKKKKNDEVPPSPGAIKLVFISAATRFRARAQSTMTDRRMIRMGKTTIMLIVVTIVYVISFLPYLGLVIHRSIYPNDYLKLSEASETTYNFFIRTYLINCAVNPIIYSFCNELFRKECLSLLKQFFRRRNS